MLELNDEELRQAARALDSYNKQLETLSRQVKLLQATRDEAARAFRALSALKDAKEGDEIMVPVGASTYITVKVTGKNAVVGVGNGVAVEKSLDDAQAYMQSQGDEITSALNEAVSAMQEVQSYTQELADAIQQEYRQRQANGVQ
ncbi:prefoldin, archaeal alpha subunit/eukaryotic subunit 5 [Thermoplasmatales archaeon BRNA1]|nr:prefoldin, archaeal alpha subunit/eukaryotic subunit 5 [Thermoplasmatales archaeon BRNA1]